MRVNQIKKASANEVLAEIKQANTLAEYQNNKVFESIANVKKRYEAALIKAAEAGNYELFSLIKQDERTEFNGE